MIPSAFAVLAALAVLLPASVVSLDAAHERPSVPLAGLAVGDSFEYTSTSLRHDGADDDPTTWLTFRATLTALSPTRAVFDIEASDVTVLYEGQESYDRVTRESSAAGHYAVFFVTLDDIQAGAAWIGDKPATYIGLTPFGHQFASGATNYYYDAASGVLSRAENLDTGAITLRSG